MEILTKINWVDILVVIIMLRVSLVALKDGLSHEIFPLVASALVLVIGLHCYGPLAHFLSENIIKIPVKIVEAVCFVALVVILGILVKLIGLLLDKVVKVTWHPTVERLGGLLAGIAKAAVVTSVILTILALVPLPYLQRSIRDRSLTGMYFLRIGPYMYDRVAPYLPTIKLGAISAGGERLAKALAADKDLSKTAAGEAPARNGTR